LTVDTMIQELADFFRIARGDVEQAYREEMQVLPDHIVQNLHSKGKIRADRQEFVEQYKKWHAAVEQARRS